MTAPDEGGSSGLLRLPPLHDPRELFELRRVGPVPGWVQLVLVAGMFVATVLLCYAEYRAKNTTFGIAGPAFNALVAPIYEELIFRGWILGRLAHRRSPALAIVVSSLLFGLLHLRNVFWLDTDVLVRTMLFTGLVLGPLLGWITLRCRSVWPAVILRYANNLLYFLKP